MIKKLLGIIISQIALAVALNTALYKVIELIVFNRI